MEFRNIFMKSDGFKLHGWFITQPREVVTDAPTIVFFHENAGNIGLRMDYFE